MNLILASHNQNKVKEIQSVLPDFISIQSLSDIGYHDEIDETGSTIEENAFIKARKIFNISHKDCFADDTGLEVMALDGVPGVYSARYAGKECNAQKNMDKLLSVLKGVENRRARFKTIFALVFDGKEYAFEGILEGNISQSPVGENGFGYDPIFQPFGYEKTLAQMSKDEKYAISHRTLALQKMTSFLEKCVI